MPSVLAMLTSTPDIRTLPDTQLRIVAAMRMGVVASIRGTKACCTVERELGSPAIAHAFRNLVTEVGHAWPEPFSINPPCQSRLSYDEMLLLDMTTAAAQGDRERFDDMTAEMLSLGSRNAIYRCAERLMPLFAR